MYEHRWTNLNKQFLILPHNYNPIILIFSKNTHFGASFLIRSQIQKYAKVAPLAKNNHIYLNNLCHNRMIKSGIPHVQHILITKLKDCEDAKNIFTYVIINSKWDSGWWSFFLVILSILMNIHCYSLIIHELYNYSEEWEMFTHLILQTNIQK